MSSEKNINIEKIIKRLKNYLNFESDTELAKFLQVSQSTISTWKTRGTFDFYRLLDKFENLNLNWLFYGEGSPEKETKYSEEIEKPDVIKEKNIDYIADIIKNDGQLCIQITIGSKKSTTKEVKK